MNEIFKDAKAASYAVACIDDSRRADILRKVADAVEARGEQLLSANREDLSRMSPDSPLYDRLMLTPERISSIASDMRSVAALPSPLGRILADRILPNGLHIRKVSVPYGVIGVVYEARPNVTFDVFSICFKSGNVCVLKGGRDADSSNQAAVAIIKDVLRECGADTRAVNLLPPTHEATGEMLSAVGLVDLVIPRGGRRLIDFVRDNAKVPCIETGAGVVNTYVDKDADLQMASSIIDNAKTRRVSVCNALDCAIFHSSLLGSLPEILEPLRRKGVLLYADERAYNALSGRYELLQPADADSFGTEFMAMKMAVRTVDSLEEALCHIAQYGSGHSESIVTRDEAAARRFMAAVDAACVYWNAPTSFTDGAQFGLGAEIGISTQKLGARGPMGLEEMTAYKWLIEGQGQLRR